MTSAVEYALRLVKDGQVLGLGSGRAAQAFVKALGERTRAGLKIRGVPTSRETEELARSFNIPLTTLDEVAGLDITVDGADEVDPALNLIKGKGGALVREKIVAASSKKLVISVGPEKLVSVLGSQGLLPVEVIPFALGPCQRELVQLRCNPVVRMKGSSPFVSDNGNYILDCGIEPLQNPGELDARLHAIPGVVDTGLFLNMADVVLIQHEGQLEVRQR